MFVFKKMFSALHAIVISFKKHTTIFSLQLSKMSFLLVNWCLFPITNPFDKNKSLYNSQKNCNDTLKMKLLYCYIENMFPQTKHYLVWIIFYPISYFLMSFAIHNGLEIIIIYLQYRSCFVVFLYMHFFNSFNLS